MAGVFTVWNLAVTTNQHFPFFRAGCETSKRVSQVLLEVKKLPANARDTETQIPSLGWEDPLEQGMATHSSILAWRIPWTEEPGRLYSPQGRKESDTTEAT